MMADIITPIDLRDYAISVGWTLVKEAIKDGLYVLNSPFNDYKQLIFPKELNEKDNDDRLELSLSRLTNATGKSRFKLIEEIREVNDDIVSLRYFSDSKVINSLSFESALQAIEGTKQLILSAASSVVNPITYHRRLSRSEPAELLKKTRFRHTQEGSFILKVSCPIELEQSTTTNLFGEHVVEPFARKTFALMNEVAYELLNAIESNDEEKFIEKVKESTSPQLSFNFCDALIGLYDDNRELPFELRFAWSRNSQRVIQQPIITPTIRFPYELKSKIEIVKNYLKPMDGSLEDVFIGTVESLSGNIDRDGARQGEVKLSLLLDGNVVSAKASLKPDQYIIADHAHMTSGTYIKIKGKLQPGKQLRLITDIVMFELVP